MMHGKLPANTITARLDTFGEGRKTKGRRAVWKLQEIGV